MYLVRLIKPTSSVELRYNVATFDNLELAVDYMDYFIEFADVLLDRFNLKNYNIIEIVDSEIYNEAIHTLHIKTISTNPGKGAHRKG